METPNLSFSPSERFRCCLFVCFLDIYIHTYVIIQFVYLFVGFIIQLFIFSALVKILIYTYILIYIVSHKIYVMHSIICQFYFSVIYFQCLRPSIHTLKVSFYWHQSCLYVARIDLQIDSNGVFCFAERCLVKSRK